MKDAMISKETLKLKFVVSGGNEVHRNEIKSNFDRLIDELPSCKIFDQCYALHNILLI